MSILSELSLLSRIIFFTLLVVIGLLTCALLWAQVGCLRCRPLENPDGTRDDWREQKLFYGVAWADVLVACPASFTAFVLIFVAPRWGFLLMGMVGFWFLWANLMTTITSLKFESPKITFQWFVVFPFGALVGASYLIWTFAHFTELFVG